MVGTTPLGVPYLPYHFCHRGSITNVRYKIWFSFAFYNFCTPLMIILSKTPLPDQDSNGILVKRLYKHQ